MGSGDAKRIYQSIFHTVFLFSNQIESHRKLQTLLQLYGLSYRLVKMMCTDPVRQSQTAVAKTDILDPDESQGKATPEGDIEGAYNLEKTDPVAASAEVASLGHLSFSNIINQIWHFCSVDYGPKCLIC
jgi:hypothetical protein